MTIVVAGQSRKAGKSTAVCDIIAATPEARWTAVKLTSHEHGADLSRPVVIEERQPNHDTDTGRYLQAGAVRAVWVRCRAEDMAYTLGPLIRGNVIVESNSAADIIASDLVVFVAAPDAAEWKPSAQRAAALANITVHGRITDDVLLRVRQAISAPIA
jgi:hypothetical protein